MKDFKKFMLFGVAFLSMAIAGCKGGSSPSSSSTEPEADPVGPSVFVLAGQSNMEGNSSFTESSLRSVFTELEIDDGDCCLTGIEEVRTSYYGQGYDHLKPEELIGSNPENKIDGLFLDTKAGMGHSSNAIGPELGCAYRLKSELEEGQKVYLIKCAFNGSGFDQGEAYPDWKLDESPNLYTDHLKIFTQNCLNLVEEEAGLKPVVRGFLWNQGESDFDDKKIPLYNDRMNNLLNTFKEDFEEYAPDGDKANIAFIDALIYERNKDLGKRLNDAKLENNRAHADEGYYYVDATEREGGLGLTCGVDNLHYDLKSMFRLGMAYADVIIENGLLG